MRSIIKLRKAAGGLVFLLLIGHNCLAQFGATQLLDGSSQSVSVPNGMMNGSTVFTIECWIKTTESRTNGTYWQCPTIIGSASSGGPSGDFGITTNNGFIGIWSGLNGGGDNSFLSSTLQINDNNWHHIAAVNNGTLINLYVDGLQQGSISSGLGLATNNAPLTIGASSLDFGFSGNIGVANFFHQGIYDEVRFSNNVRYTSNFTVTSSAFTADANTIALYHLDGCVGGLVPDASSNANNAHPHNLTGSCAFTLPPTPTIPANSPATNIVKAEYYFDTDPGFGSGTDMPVSAAMDVSFSYPVNTQPLSNGSHRLYVRTKDAASNWSLTNVSSFFIVPPPVTLPATPTYTKIMKAEYFYDTDPGFGNGTDMLVTPTFDLSGSFTVNTTALQPGVHRIYLRTRDSLKNWSLTNIASFYILAAPITIPSNSVPADIVKAEYFLDTDPGFGNGTDLPVTAGNDITLNNAFINISGLSNGIHRLYLRTKNSNGSWSLTSNNGFNILAASFSLPPNPVPGNITRIEYFFDTDPGFGNGHIVSIAPTTDLNNYSLAVDVSALNDSVHTLYIRSFDDWGLTNTKTFIKGAPLPVTWLSFNATTVADSVLLKWQTANETNNARFYIERSADARSFSSIGNIAGNGNTSANHAYQFTDHNPLQGVSYYRIRQVDLDGNFKYSVVIAVQFGKQSPAISVFPNPANNVVTILFDKVQDNDAGAALLDVYGQLLQSFSLAGMQSKQLNVSALANGTYQLRVHRGQTISTQKIIIQHSLLSGKNTIC